MCIDVNKILFFFFVVYPDVSGVLEAYCFVKDTILKWLIGVLDPFIKHFLYIGLINKYVHH